MKKEICDTLQNDSSPNRIASDKDEHVTKRMKGNKGKDTKPELQVRKLLTAKGVRGYRVCYKEIIGKPDLVFLKRKIAIFVHGCFWHSCPNCNLKVPNNNHDFWLKKLTGNKNRDEKVYEALQSSGWNVVTIWECKLKCNPDQEIEGIVSLLTTIN